MNIFEADAAAMKKYKALTFKQYKTLVRNKEKHQADARRRLEKIQVQDAEIFQALSIEKKLLETIEALKKELKEVYAAKQKALHDYVDMTAKFHGTDANHRKLSENYLNLQNQFDNLLAQNNELANKCKKFESISEQNDLAKGAILILAKLVRKES